MRAKLARRASEGPSHSRAARGIGSSWTFATSSIGIGSSCLHLIVVEFRKLTAIHNLQPALTTLIGCRKVWPDVRLIKQADPGKG